MREDLLNRELKLNVEYRVGGQEFASFIDSNGEDIGKNLIMDGLMLAEKKGGNKLKKLVDSYRDAMESAKKNHLNIWYMLYATHVIHLLLVAHAEETLYNDSKKVEKS